MAHDKNAAIEQRVIDQAHYFVHAAAPHFDIDEFNRRVRGRGGRGQAP